MRVFKYQAEGTEDEAQLPSDYSRILPDEVKKIRQSLREFPDDLRNRLILFGRGFWGHSGSYIAHLNWLIDNHPKHGVHQFITLHKKDDAYQQARLRWLRHVRTHPDDVTILVHAAKCFMSVAAEDSVKFLSKAAELDAYADDIPRELSFVYRLMAGHFSLKKNQQLAHKSVEQLKIAIERYALPNEEGDSYLMPYFSMVISETARMALGFGLIEDAKELARILLDHRSINAKRWSMLATDHSNGYFLLSAYRAHVILGEASLVLGQVHEAKEHLFSMTHIQAGKFAEFGLAQNLAQIGETSVVIAYLESLIGQDHGEFLDPADKDYAAKRKKRNDRWIKNLKRSI